MMFRGKGVARDVRVVLKILDCKNFRLEINKDRSIEADYIFYYEDNIKKLLQEHIVSLYQPK